MCVIVYRILVPRNPWSFFSHMQYKPVRQQTHMDNTHEKHDTRRCCSAQTHGPHSAAVSTATCEDKHCRKHEKYSERFHEAAFTFRVER